LSDVAKLHSQFRHVDPAALLPRLESEFSQLDTSSALEKIMRELRILGNVA
jgi:hypothetical protein